MSSFLPAHSPLGALPIDPTLVGGKRNSPSAREDSPLNDAPAQPMIELSTIASGDSHQLAFRAIDDSCQLETTRYEIREEIGRGGCGIVLRAYDREMHREVVIKRVFANNERSKEITTRFLNEALITGRLEHPGIVPVHEIGRTEKDGVPYYVMKWLRGQTLNRVILQFHEMKKQADKKSKQRELLVRFHQVCQTLAYAHRLNIIHRDLKPANIMVGQFGETVVLDWGLAKDLGIDESEQMLASEVASDATRRIAFDNDDNLEAHSSQRSDCKPRANSSQSNSNGIRVDGLTQAGTVLGTASYMSPEQARGESNCVDCRSDVFSLGVILYEILAGVSPFRSPSVETTLKLVARAEFRDLRKCNRLVPRALAAIAHRAMNLDPNQRYRDAAELSLDIENYLAGNTVSAYREPWYCLVDRIATKHSTVVRSVFLALFAVAMFSILGVARIDQSRRAEITARMLAEQESRDKLVAFERERIAHSSSLQQLQAARKATDAWLIDLSGELQFYPGLESVRLHLLAKAKEYYQANIDSAGTLEGDRIELARSHLRLGDIARLTNDQESAAVHYATALNVLPMLSSDVNAISYHENQTTLANALIGQSLCSLESTESQDIGMSNAIKAAAIVQGVANADPENRDAKKTWLRSQQIIARLYSNDRNYQSAAQALEQPIRIAELLNAQLSDTSTFHLLTSMLTDRATALQFDHQWDSSTDNLQRLVSLYSQRTRQYGARPDWLEARANAYLQLGNCNSQLMKPKSSLSDLESSELDTHAAWEILSDNPFYQESIAITKANLGKAFFDAGDTDRAEDMLRNAIVRLQSVIKRVGTSRERVTRMVNLFLSLAAVTKEKTDSASQVEFSNLLQKADVLLQHLNNISNQIDWLPLKAEWSVLTASRLEHSTNWQGSRDFIERALQELQPPTSLSSHAHSSLRFALSKLNLALSRSLWELDEKVEARNIFQMATASLYECGSSIDNKMSFHARTTLIHALCTSPVASQQDVKRALFVAEPLVRDAMQHPAAWHDLAFAAWKNGELARGQVAMVEARRLRWRPTIEDDLLTILVSEQGSASDATSMTSIRKQYEEKSFRSDHAKYLMEQIMIRQNQSN